MIKAIKVKNFKTFKELDVELGNFNVLIGANASGKSNFISIFRFLKDIVSTGLGNAISMHGGVEYLRNINIGASKNLSIKVVFDREFRAAQLFKGDLVGMRTYEIIYEFALKFNKRGSGFTIVRDELVLKYKVVRLEKKRKKIEEKDIFGNGEIIISRGGNGKINIDINMPNEIPLKEGDIFPSYLREERLSRGELLLERPFFLIPFPIKLYLEDIAIYDFDPKLSRRAYPVTGKAELEENGANLSIVIKN
ncbi:AAA family ATPase, partial [bacterium]|nr:AAA family ATPase [bacterium]